MLRSEGGALTSGISALMNETQELALSALPVKDTGRRRPSAKQEGAPARHKICWHPNLGPQAPGLGGMYVCCLSHPAYCNQL